jgi:hypothetical protein
VGANAAVAAITVKAKLAGLWRDKVAVTDPSGERAPRYIISDHPMTEEEWERERASPGSTSALRPITSDRETNHYNLICVVGFGQNLVQSRATAFYKQPWSNATDFVLQPFVCNFRYDMMHCVTHPEECHFPAVWKRGAHGKTKVEFEGQEKEY